MSKRSIGFVSRLRRDRQGQIVVVTAASLTMLGILLGFVVDFSRSQAMQSKLNSIADAAALAAVDPALADKSDAAATAASNALWSGQTTGLPDVTSITMTPAISSSSGGGRTMTITWSANSRNLFSSFLGLSSLRISGSSTAASAPASQSIDFYVVLDNSPSMLLPTTTAGITALTSKRGCAFACHISEAFAEVGPITDSSGRTIILDSTYYDTKVSGDSGAYRADFTNRKLYDINGNLIANNVNFLGYTNTTNGNGFYMGYFDLGGSPHEQIAYYADSFWLTQNYGRLYPTSGINNIPLRIDAMQSALQQLVGVAKSKAALISGSARYSMQFWLINQVLDPLTTSMTDVRSISASSLIPAGGTLAPYIREFGYFPSTLSDKNYPGSPAPGNGVSDHGGMLYQMYHLIPTAGSGLPGATPMKTLLIVTDGMIDVYDPSTGGSVHAAWNDVNIAYCNGLKSHGVKIAILYTTYDPKTITAPYPDISSVTSQILPQLQACASTDPKLGSLVYTVSADQDMSSALSNLFVSTIPGSPKLIR